MASDLGYPKDGSGCCSRAPEPSAEVWERCPECLHFMMRIDDVLNCTWPDCPTNKLDYHCGDCGEDFDVYDKNTLQDVEPDELTKCPFCDSQNFVRNDND